MAHDFSRKIRISAGVLQRGHRIGSVRFACMTGLVCPSEMARQQGKILVPCRPPCPVWTGKGCFFLASRTFLSVRGISLGKWRLFLQGGTLAGGLHRPADPGLLQAPGRPPDFFVHSFLPHARSPSRFPDFFFFCPVVPGWMELVGQRLSALPGKDFFVMAGCVLPARGRECRSLPTACRLVLIGATAGTDPGMPPSAGGRGRARRKDDSRILPWTSLLLSRLGNGLLQFATFGQARRTQLRSAGAAARFREIFDAWTGYERKKRRRPATRPAGRGTEHLPARVHAVPKKVS